jgi:hypothetical protein
MAKKRIIATPVIATPVDDFTLTLVLGDKTYTSSGDSVVNALSSLQKPTKIVCKGTLSVDAADGRKVSKLITIQEAKRLFYPLSRALTARNLSYLLK